MFKVILFYKFVPIADTQTVMFWQRNLCERLNLKGRIIISNHGINATLGGDIKNVKLYTREMKAHDLFNDIEYKWGDSATDPFPRLSVKIRKELVTLSPEEEFDVFNKGTPLRPKAWHDYLEKHPDAIIFDARNDYESDIGKFKGAITPKIGNFRDVKEELEKLPKDKPILTYCTGDVRCEYLSAYMKHKGFPEVYHLEGGIVKYGQEFKDEGHWEGKLYVFDDRISIGFSDKSADIGECVHCGKKTSHYINCAKMECNKQVLVCEKCSEDSKSLSTHCSDHK
jgi:UPF0176 protein